MALDKGFWDELDGAWEDGLKDEADNLPNSYDILPVGNYDCKVVDWKFIESEDKGTPGLNIEFYVLNKPHESRRIWHTFWLSPAALPYTCRDIRTLTGIRIQKPSEIRDMDFLNCTAHLKVKHETYNDKTNVRVGSILPMPEGATASSSSDDDDSIPF